MPTESEWGTPHRTPHESAACKRPDELTVAVDPAAFDARGSAAFVAVSRAHWLRLVASGRAPRGMKLGARRVWSRAELTAWIEAGAPPLARWMTMHGRGGGR